MSTTEDREDANPNDVALYREIGLHLAEEFADSKVLIFGGGRFTHRFIDAQDVGVLKVFAGIADDNAGQGESINTLKVAKPEEFFSKGIDAVLLATDTYESLFEERVGKLFSPDIRMIPFSELRVLAMFNILDKEGRIITEEDDVAEGGNMPEVSVFCFVKNRSESIARCVESVLAQSYPNIDFIVQDGASTDGTAEILASYGEKISLLSEPDRDISEAFWKAIRRCRGKYIACCLSDEELLPGMIFSGVRFMEAHPDIAAVTRDVLLSDLDGNCTGWVAGTPFELPDYLASKNCPHFSTTIFRKDALDDIGLMIREWDCDCGEFEMWSRLGVSHKIAYLKGVVAKYSLHGEQLSNDPDNMRRLLLGRLRVLRKLYAEIDNIMSLAELRENIDLTVESFDRHAGIVLEGSELVEWRGFLVKLLSEDVF